MRCRIDPDPLHADTLAGNIGEVLHQIEAPTAAGIGELEDSLGGVVDAAAGGDFSHWIEARFDEVEPDAMAVSVNRLVENVQAGVSERIGEIVSVIDGIAFQANLLALNASVEAARAGTAGKGFAVVATEVRALARRSGEASQDIKMLIDETSRQVARGVDLVERTGPTLSNIFGGVRDMASVMQELPTTAREQATGVQEATTAISQIDITTQKNAALADERRGPRQGQTESIQQMVGSFRNEAGVATPEETSAAVAAE